MNRRLTCATALLLTTFVAPPAQAQTPLVVGAVRDQRGVAVAGAAVLGHRSNQAPLRTTTDASGTFALEAPGIVSIGVTCRYCGPAVVSVRPGEPVVVIVERYEALAADSPSSSDLENLPYAHVESALALRPFMLLQQSVDAYPGSRLSDRGLSPTGSLLIDDGAANYDIVNGSSPYELVPAQYERTATLSDASNAYLYGDQAAGGTVNANPFGSDSNWQAATLGSDAIARAQIGSDNLGAVLGSLSNDEESRQRADLSASFSPGAGQSLSLAAGSEQGRTFASGTSQYAGSFSFADATYAAPQLANLYASAVVDRGNYAVGTGENAWMTAWSDSGFNVGVRSVGAVSAFADLGIRSSTGLYYEPEQYYALNVGGNLTQTRADAGVNAVGRDYDVTAGVGTFWIDYAGGTTGVSQPAKAALALPSIQALLFGSQRWSIDLQDSDSFTLPTFVDEYAYSSVNAVEYDRNALLAEALTYTDQARLRVSLEQATQHVAGASSGTITSAGLSAIWQVAPAISLRAWTMHVTDTVPAYGETTAYDGNTAPTVNAFWLTYDSNNGIRLDAIYRRDLLGGAPFYHVDGDLSGPIANRLRWYSGIEDRMRRTFLDVGLRFGQ
ncbi:MAG TPA: carboxypeptidase-like regulatory domain-containing protein [Candidatus Cybelea sp.]|nr:carboxypeptidase-like regulatory domain-containing protein [Candidatus Cybelea sp.]